MIVPTGSGLDADGPALLAAELRALGVRAIGLEADLAQPDAYLHVLDTASRQLGAPIDPGKQRCAFDQRWL